MRIYSVAQSPRHTEEVFAPAGVTRVLVSFAIMKPSQVDAWRRSFANAGITDVLLDSGAFSAFTRGLRIDLADYYRVIDTLRPSWYAALDVIGDAAATKRNLDRMEADGYTPLPVYTRGAPLSDLRDLIQRGYGYVAVGNIARAPRKNAKQISLEEVRRCLRGVFSITRDTTAVHGFGVMRSDLLAEFPFASVDASSSTMATALGNRYDLSGLKLTQQHMAAKRERIVAAPHLTHLGGSDRRESNRARLLHNLRQTVELESRVTRLWAARGVTWPDHEAWAPA